MTTGGSPVMSQGGRAAGSLAYFSQDGQLRGSATWHDAERPAARTDAMWVNKCLT